MKDIPEEFVACIGIVFVIASILFSVMAVNIIYDNHMIANGYTYHSTPSFTEGQRGGWNKP